MFTRPEAVEVILDSWRYLQKNDRLDIFAFVILTNHLHIVAAANELPTVLQRFKSYTAKEIITLLESQGAKTLLRQLEAMKLNHKTESKYQVWQEGSKPKQIQGDEMMWQKIEYTHNNPVKRGFVDDPLHWRLSSARNYSGMDGVIEVVTDWR